MNKNCDFSGWATKNNLRCSDGRTIRRDAFADQDGDKVPLVWQHRHDDPSNVIGHAYLENRPEGVYAYCSFNDSKKGQDTKILVEHGDVCALSIFANHLTEQSGNVLHGIIREVSVVMAGANPGALIEHPILAHADGNTYECEDEAYIYTGEKLVLSHSDNTSDTDSEEIKHEDSETKDSGKENEMADNKEKTVQDVIDTMNEEQKAALMFIVTKVKEEYDAEHDDMEEGDDSLMHTNCFDQDDQITTGGTLSHSEMETIIKDTRRFGSIKESFMQHADEYGIQNIEYLFPDAKKMENAPAFINTPNEWVSEVMKNVHHTPFSRVKSVFADITEDDARAKGYLKGKMKKEEFFPLIKRTTEPTTVYKKQKFDKQDLDDITDFDVIAWIKTEMRMKLDEELAGAFLLGDRRPAGSDDHIDTDHIRPVWTDNDLFTIKQEVVYPADATEYEKLKLLIAASIKSRKNYRGSGNLTFFTTEDTLADLLLMDDGIGHPLYEDEAKLAKALRARNIVTVPQMEGLIRTSGTKHMLLLGILVNMADYNVGADHGGAVDMFDDFDIDYNQQKYLIETRCSGALIKPYSAIVLETEVA